MKHPGTPLAAVGEQNLEVCRSPCPRIGLGIVVSSFPGFQYLHANDLQIPGGLHLSSLCSFGKGFIMA